MYPSELRIYLLREALGAFARPAGESPTVDAKLQETKERVCVYDALRT